jgi:hypothetical protein
LHGNGNGANGSGSARGRLDYPGVTVRVLYIAGLSHSGSTILARTVGAADGLFVAGELHYLWRRGVLEDRTCGCGAPFGSCEIWTAVLERMRSEDGLNAETMSRIEHRLVRARRLPLALARRRVGLPLERSLDGYVRTLGGLYRAIHAVTGCRAIIDSSKDPYYGWVLGQAPGLEVSIVHLVRDPHGTEFSRARKHGPDRIGLVRGALGWSFGHAAAEILWSKDHVRYTRIRYEDFAKRPQEIVEALRRLAGAQNGPAARPSASTFELPVHHTVSGNRNRFEAGPTTIRLDDAWRDGLAPRDRRVVTALTLPLLRRYRYRAWPAPTAVRDEPPAGA